MSDVVYMYSDAKDRFEDWQTYCYKHGGQKNYTDLSLFCFVVGDFIFSFEDKQDVPFSARQNLKQAYYCSTVRQLSSNGRR